MVIAVMVIAFTKFMIDTKCFIYMLLCPVVSLCNHAINMIERITFRELRY